MKDILRYLMRRKMRTILTIMAVTVGIFAVTAVGGIAEQLESQIQTVEMDALSRINVWTKDYYRSISDAEIRQIRRVEGVTGVTLTISGRIEKLKEDTVVVVSINPLSFVGIQSDVPGLEYEALLPGMELWAGRLPEPGNRTETVVTWRMAQAKDLEVGETLLIQEKPFEVVGIWEDHPSAISRLAYISYEAAENILGQDTFGVVSIIPKPGTDLEALAQRVEEQIPELNAQSPTEAVKEARQQVLIFSLIVGASGIISLLIGTFTIVNTMVVSVQERRREIGLKKALGAEDKHILTETIIEAILIAGTGGTIGVLLGTGVGAIANKALNVQLGMPLFLPTLRLTVGAVGFSILMGIMAGIYPAWKASRLDPIITLRGASAATGHTFKGIKGALDWLRRNARSILTVSGITIGIFALVLLGSLTEALNGYMQDFSQGSHNLLMVNSKYPEAPLNRTTVRDLERVPGVASISMINQGQYPVRFTPDEDDKEKKLDFWCYDPETGDLGLAMPMHNEIEKGQMLAPRSNDTVVLGAGLAETHNLDVGDTLYIKDQKFTVVGIWKRIPFDLGGHDASGYLTLEGMQRIEADAGGIGGIGVRTKPGASNQAMVELLETEFHELDVMATQDVLGGLSQFFTTLTAIMIGIFSIAVFVSTVSIVNTMIIAVNEKTREIGLKKAVGADDGDILAEVLMEAAGLGALGGATGNVLAWIATAVINPMMKAQQGIDILNLSPRLILGSIIFSILLGIFAGLIPARKAARLDPVIALHTD
ncbi:MAG: ABC transporter permease [Anaerolineae bacterium]|nr:ABC transporter permease [Anaerolineae bacterium]